MQSLKDPVVTSFEIDEDQKDVANYVNFAEHNFFLAFGWHSPHLDDYEDISLDATLSASAFWGRKNQVEAVSLLFIRSFTFSRNQILFTPSF